LATFDDRIDVSVLGAVGLASPRGLTRGILLSSDSAFSERVRSYNTLSDALADTTLSASAKADCEIAFAQTVCARPLYVGRCAVETKQTTEITISTAADGAWVLGIGDEEYTYTAAGGDSAATIASALKVLAAADLLATVDVSGAVLDIEAQNPGEAFAVTLTPPSGGARTIVQVDAVLIASELTAIRAENAEWFGLVAPRHTELATKHHIALWCAAEFVLCAAPVASLSDGAALRALTYRSTFACMHSTAAGDFAVAWLFKRLHADPDKGNSRWDWLGLVGVAADSISASDANTARASKLNLYLSSDFATVTGEGVTLYGEPINAYVSREWVRTRVRTAVARLLTSAAENEDLIAYDNAGILQMANVVLSVLLLGEALKHCKPATSAVIAPDITQVADADIAAGLLRLEGETEINGGIGAAQITIQAPLA
jgi:hypothetical protein